MNRLGFHAAVLLLAAMPLTTMPLTGLAAGSGHGGGSHATATTSRGGDHARTAHRGPASLPPMYTTDAEGPVCAADPRLNRYEPACFR